MTPSTSVESEAAPASTDVNVNDFTINVATVNGTGSQTANATLIRTIMRMGVPASGKNVFPSNIQGLPTWYVIRVCEEGWIAPRAKADVLICMNRETARDDVMKCAPGAWVIYDAPFNLDTLRDDVSFFPVPFATLVKDVAPPKLWRLVTNMIYVGVAAQLLGLETEAVEDALGKAFGSKPKALEVNVKAANAGRDFAREAFTLPAGGYRVERRNLTEGKILIDGNSATGLGAVMAGVTVVTWYPITPSTSSIEATEEYLEKYRYDENGKATFAVLQAEDELAAIGMVLGAGWAGARSMTATSGPGISLMSEFIGLSYYAEVPAVIVNVQRVGPSTGLPTRTMQCDILFCAYNSHGDTKHPLLLPASPQEAYEMTMNAFDLAERFQTAVFLVSDLDLGMNNWMSDPFPYSERPLDRGKVLDAEKLAEIGVKEWGRYKDLDGDGIPWRTLPGLEVDGAAYFTRGSGHNEYARYTESSEAYEANVERLLRKFDTMRSHVPEPIRDDAEGGSRVGVIAYGTTHWSLIEARALLERKHGVKFDYLRLCAFPFQDSVEEFVNEHDHVYVVEQNRDGQMLALMRHELPQIAAKLRSLRYYDGMPIRALQIVDDILSKERAQ